MNEARDAWVRTMRLAPHWHACVVGPPEDGAPEGTVTKVSVDLYVKTPEEAAQGVADMVEALYEGEVIWDEWTLLHLEPVNTN